MSFRLVKYIINEDGTTEPVEDLLEWGRLIEKVDARNGRVVGKTNVKGGLEVSTMFIPLDQSVFGSPSDAPLVFETLIFARGTKIRSRRQKIWKDGQFNYADIEAARKGHKMVCELIQMNLWPHPKHSRNRIRRLTKAFYDRAKNIV